MALTWGSKTNETQKTGVSNSEEYFSAWDLSGVYETQVEVKANNESGSVTDALLVRVYLTLDDSSHDWDDQAWQSFSFLPGTISEEKMTFTIPIVYGARIGVESAGATDDYTVDVSRRELTAV